LIASLLTEVDEGRRVYEKYTVGDSAGQGFGLWVAILVSSVMSFGISYGSSWCVRVTSSTTYSMVGALNKLPISIFGMLLFDDAVGLGQILGVLLGMRGI
jgi:GDP-mannose transporter